MHKYTVIVLYKITWHLWKVCYNLLVSWTKQTKELNTMMNLNDIKNQLLVEIENEKGFSFKKLAKIIELNAVLNNLQ